MVTRWVEFFGKVMGTVEIRRRDSEETSGEESRKRFQTISKKNQLKGKKVGQKNEGKV